MYSKIIPVIAATTSLSLSMASFAARTSDPEPEQAIKQISKDLNFTADAFKLAKGVARALGKMGFDKRLGEVAGKLGEAEKAAKRAEKIFNDIDDKDSDKEKAAEAKEQKGAVEKLLEKVDLNKQLEGLKAKVENLKFTLIDSDQPQYKVTVSDLAQDKQKALKKFDALAIDMKENIKTMNIAKSNLDELAKRAEGAKTVLQSLSETCAKIWTNGGTIFGDFFGYKWLDLEEQAKLCSDIHSATQLKLITLNGFIKEEQRRYDTLKDNLKSLFGHDL